MQQCIWIDCLLSMWHFLQPFANLLGVCINIWPRGQIQTPNRTQRKRSSIIVLYAVGDPSSTHRIAFPIMRGIAGRPDKETFITPPSPSPVTQRVTNRSASRKAAARESALLLSTPSSGITSSAGARCASPTPPTGDYIQEIQEYIQRARDVELLHYQEKLTEKEKLLNELCQQLLYKEGQLIKVRCHNKPTVLFNPYILLGSE